MSVKTKAALEVLSNLKILSGGKRTTAAGIREVNSALIESLVALLDDKDVPGGYLGIHDAGKVDNSFIDFPSTDFKSLFVSFDDVGNQSGETDLMLNDLSPDTIASEGDSLECEYSGQILGSATDTRQLKIYVQNNLIFNSGAISITANTGWVLKTTIIRGHSTTIRFSHTLTIQRTAGIQNFVTVDEFSGVDYSQPFQVKLTGQSAGMSAGGDEIILKLSRINFIKSPQ